MTKTPRLANFEVLRVLAMLMIIIWHFLFHGIGDTPFEGRVGLINYAFSQLLYVLCSSCVNLFVLVSGYFLIDKRFNWHRVAKLWFEVVFYAFGISLLFFFLQPGAISGKEVLQDLLPVRFRPYWFFQKYFGLVCLAPFLSKAVTSLTQRQYKRFIVILFFLSCTLTFYFPYGDLMGAAKGYDLIWFIALFFFGGYFRLYPPSFSSKQLRVGLLVILVLATLFIILKAYFIRHSFFLEMPAYNGIGFLVACPVFLWFQQKKFASNWIVRTLASIAPYTFGIYLISEHPCVWPWLWHDLYDWTSLMDSPWYFPVLILTVVIIFVSCVCLDFLRSRLFQVSRLDSLVEWTADRISNGINHVLK